MRISDWSSDVCSSDLGGELTPRTMFQAAAEIATVCASTAWVAQLLAVHSHAIAYYDPRLQEEIWGADPDALVGSSVAPVGKVTPVEGGYRLSGRSEEHTSELQSLMRISYAVFCLKKKKK